VGVHPEAVPLVVGVPPVDRAQLLGDPRRGGVPGLDQADQLRVAQGAEDDVARRPGRLGHDAALAELLGLSTDDPANLAQLARKYRRLAAPESSALA
jgi:hypothetical protein